jgi:predicted kinase
MTVPQNSVFADNSEGQEARKEAAVATFHSMLKWFREGGQVACFDATNSSAARRQMLADMAEGQCKVRGPQTFTLEP